MNSIFLLIILIPIIEIYLLIKIGAQIGALTTIVFTLLTASLGILTIKLQSLTSFIQAKESIFNIINHSNNFSVKIENSYILDLFSGVGSFGIDCLSRGAKEVIFVENYNKVLPILKKNLLRKIFKL